MRKLLALVASLSLALGLTMFSAGSATALGGETFGCRVAPGPWMPYEQYCWNGWYAPEYTVGFAVENVTGPVTYSWSVPPEYTSMVVGGCTSSSYDCAVSVPNANHYIPVSVTITQSGASRTLSAIGMISSSQDCGEYVC